MTISTADRPVEAPEQAAAPGRRHWLSPGWLPFVVALAGTAASLLYYDVPAGDLIKFAAYTLLAGTLPGTLIWRALRGGAGVLALDAAFGTVVGFVVELPVYLVARACGVPLAVLAWPILTLVLFAAVPSLRRHWRGTGLRMPVGVSWTVAAGMLYCMGRAMALTFRSTAPTDPHRLSMILDFPFQFALVGLFKNGVRLDMPFVDGVGLSYHWYVYPHGAAASWITGIEPEMLILRLLVVPMIAAFLLLLVALAHRLSGRWWAGALAVVLALAGTAISPYAWGDRPMYNGVITEHFWQSPTQSYAVLLCAAALYVLAGLLVPGRKEPNRLVAWGTYAVLTGAMAGAKATFLPVLLCGLALAVGVRLLRTRKLGAEAIALAITLVWFAFAQLVLYSGGAQGMVVDPLQTVKWTILGWAVFGGPRPVNHEAALFALAATAVLAMAISWAGLAALARRTFRWDPMVHVLLGIGLSGTVATWVFAHPGLSQGYFARSASPFLAVLSAVGLAALVPAGGRAPRWFARLTAAAAVLGVAALLAVQFTAGRPRPPGPATWSTLHAVGPYLLLTAVLVVLAAALAVIGRQTQLGRRRTAAVMVVPFLTASIATGLLGARELWPDATAGHANRYPATAAVMPAGAAEAGRWLRDHSAPGDRVATNSHCRFGGNGCDSRDFWLAGYSERQVLLEGWSYTEPAFASGGLWDYTLAGSPFWDPALLAANDEIFYHPTTANVAAFTRSHHIRWLVAVGTMPNPARGVKNNLHANPSLAQFAEPRFRAGDITVYEVRDNG
ncbi:hypothetical protein ACIA5D_07540 [Actinoplanes sp. NPDC051513]|uniref:hypothetical protein n=1 Tax=Actinoplanes sp. NPDC051513 TaxID=3363908 RepID=UPI00379FFB29